MRLALEKAASLYRDGDYESSADLFYTTLMKRGVLVDYDTGTDFSATVEEAFDRDENDLGSSSEHKEKGLLSPNRRVLEFIRIIKELRMPGDYRDPTREEISGMQDLCYRLYCSEVSDKLARLFNVGRNDVRKALDSALLWHNTQEHLPGDKAGSGCEISNGE